ncbi:hypothetical protein SNK04_010089 [Fusarium graminearum]|nr:hypothetical protein HG531_008783 [Fusarium graminearum]
MILIFVRGAGGAPGGGVLVAGLADLGFGVEFECVLKEIFLSGGDDAGPPGKGLRAASPVGRGFLAGLAVIESDLEFERREGPSLEPPDGSDVRPLMMGFFWSFITLARRCGVTLSLTMRLFFFLAATPESAPKGFSTFGRFGAGVWCSSLSGRGRLTLVEEGGSGGHEGFEPDEEEVLGCRERTGEATIVSRSPLVWLGFGL